MEEKNSIVGNKPGLNPMLLGGLVLLVIIVVGGVYISLQRNSGEEKMDDAEKAAPAVMQVVPSSSPSSVMKAESATKSFVLETGSFYFTPDKISVKKGDTVKLTVTNKGGMHKFVIDEFQVKTLLPTGKPTEITFVADKVGTFEFYCAIGQHRVMGQKGTLVIE